MKHGGGKAGYCPADLLRATAGAHLALSRPSLLLCSPPPAENQHHLATCLLGRLQCFSRLTFP